MFDLINGIPVHPLVVHAVVVLLPLAVLGTIAIALRPRWRVTYGPLVVGAAAIATVLVPVATSSGEELEKRVGDPGEHAELGEQLLFFAIALLVLSAALVWLAWRASRATTATPDPTTGPTTGPTPGPTTLINVVAGLAVIAAVACAVQVYRVGDSGARAAWGDVPEPRAVSSITP
ncbi:MAG: hypothetical protein F2667_00900 [Actinobacteria bacterium]|uniref:Unannotated protein n=1 Tax=freshwater metagenome TaxID=449393 RepID=A0A6J6NRD2_9ZZZZ|nr:hypothetical protein [Actinomycetota bacterium]